MTAIKGTRKHSDLKIEDFLHESEDSMQSNDSVFDLHKESVTPREPKPVPNTPLKVSGKAAKIIDLSNDDGLYDFQIKEPEPGTKPKAPKPINPYAVSQVEKKTTFTTNQLRDVHQKRL
jgi:hypothetical protein